MHDIDTTRLETEPLAETGESYESFEELDTETEMSDELSEVEELELATDLLSVSNEAEMDQFIGKLFKKAWKGIKKVGSTIGKVAKPFAGVLKGIAKKALPFVGGALGSFIPIPGVGTAVGSALGTAVSKALELELEGMEPEDREFEMARRFVRLAHHAARNVARTDPRANPRTAILAAIKAAMQKQRAQGAPAKDAQDSEPAGEFEFSPQLPTAASTRRSQSGRWVRQGNQIILTGI